MIGGALALVGALWIQSGRIDNLKGALALSEKNVVALTGAAEKNKTALKDCLEENHANAAVAANQLARQKQIIEDLKKSTANADAEIQRIREQEYENRKNADGELRTLTDELGDLVDWLRRKRASSNPD